MSDQQLGPDWWLASDGRWYPPETRFAPPPSPPPRTGMSSGAVAALVVGGVLALLFLVGAAVTLLGTEADSDGDEAAEVAAVVVPDGYVLAEGDGVSLAVPAAWTVIDASMSPEQMATAFPGASPDLVAGMSALVDGGALLVAFDRTDVTFASNINVLHLAGEEDPSVLMARTEREITAAGAEVLSSREVQLPIGPAVRVELLGDATMDGSTQQVSSVAYFVGFDGSTYVVSITTGADAGPVADQMMTAFRVG